MTTVIVRALSAAGDAPPSRTTETRLDHVADGQLINDPKATRPAYRVNANGQTYGSAADSPRPDLEPDLIAVVTLESGDGYVYATELNGPEPTTPEEAQKVTEMNKAGRTITAYSSDGTTTVGTFPNGGQ